RHAVALQSEHLAVLRRRRNLQPQRLAAERCDLGFAAEHRGRERNRDARVQIAALPLEARVRREPDSQIEIAGLCAAAALLAFAADPNARTVADAGRNPD